jgi:MFS transporter, PPP family, 3-phenylpropionic acid transporter
MSESRAPSTPAVARISPLVVYHLTHGAFLGVVTPYLVLYFQTLSLSLSQASFLASIGPLLSIFAPALWGSWADRNGRLARVLRVACVGAMVAFVGLLLTREVAVLLAAVALYEFFNSGKAPILDAIVLHRVSAVGGSYSHIRVFTSASLMASGVLIGFVVPIGQGLMLVAGALLVLNLIASLRLHAASAAAPRAERDQGGLATAVSILRHPGFAVLLACGCLHAIASAPYEMTFFTRALQSGLPAWLPGLNQSVATAAEIGIMLCYPLLARRFSARQLLCAAFLASAVRWALLPLAVTTPAILSLALLHAFTFGVFFLAGTDFIFHRVPAHLRATGQGLFFSLAFGLGGFLGNSVSGLAYETLGASIYLAAAGVELLALTVILVTSRAPGLRLGLDPGRLPV